MNQKFFSQPSQRSLDEDVLYEIVRRNESTGELESIGFQTHSEEVTRMVASILNQEYLKDSEHC